MAKYYLFPRGIYRTMKAGFCALGTGAFIYPVRWVWSVCSADAKGRMYKVETAAGGAAILKQQITVGK